MRQRPQIAGVGHGAVDGREGEATTDENQGLVRKIADPDKGVFCKNSDRD